MEVNACIRAARREDVPGILAVYNQAALHTLGTYDEEPQSLSQRLEWFDHAQSKHHPILVAVGGASGEEVLGWGALGPFLERAGFRHTAVEAVYVGGASRRRGIGRRLLSALMDEARRAAIHTVLAAVDESNVASLQLHLNAGFVLAGTFREVAHKAGCWHTVLYLQRML